ncbi:MAG: hypothetical protein M3O82_06280 [Verrucomicrobiota bacterium]|nr:hypothetical protein [Verrucomicrobiota bacterium]
MKPESVTRRSFVLAPIFGAFFLCPSTAQAQIENVHTHAGGHGFNVSSAARNEPSSAGDQDRDEAPDVFDWTSYSKELHVESHVDANPDLPAPAVDATAGEVSGKSVLHVALTAI